MKILVTGSTGQLGYDVVERLKKEPRNIVRGVGRADFDLTDEKAVRANILEFRPDAVIHCAAYTAVDKAEGDADRCYQVNALGTEHVAKAVRDVGGKLLYISTDYVFDGQLNRSYETDDAPNPINVYGRSKLEGERSVASLLEQYFIVRISWVFGSNGNNFVKTMLRLGSERPELNVVSDQIGSPTYTGDLAVLMADMIKTEKYGLYHATNEGYCSWHEFAQEIFERAGMPTQVNAIPSSEYPTRAERPKNSRLSKRSLVVAGFGLLPDWQDAVGRFLIQY